MNAPVICRQMPALAALAQAGAAGATHHRIAVELGTNANAARLTLRRLQRSGYAEVCGTIDVQSTCRAYPTYLWRATVAGFSLLDILRRAATLLADGEALPTSAQRRILMTVRLDDRTECWEWCGTRRANGYGQLWIDGARRMAHRASYEAFRGAIPEGLTLDHLCRNRGCVNPAHLEPVTNGENVLRGASAPAQNARKSHCHNGHALEGDNVYRHRGQRLCRQCRREYRQRRAENPAYRAREAARMRRSRAAREVAA